MDENLTQQQQGTTAEEASPALSISEQEVKPTVAPVEAVAAPTAPAQPAPSAVPASEVERLRASAARLEQDIRALKSTKDKELYDQQMRFREQLAQMQAQLYQAETAGMPEDERAKYDLQRLQQENQFYQQQMQAYEAERAAQANFEGRLQLYRSLGIPDSVVLTPEATASPQNMEIAAMAYLVGQAKRPEPPAKPVAVPTAPAQAPPTPPITTHSQAAQPSDLEERAEELRKRSKEGEDTLFDGYQVLQERWSRGAR